MAELFRRIDEAPSKEDRADAEARTVETILRIWSHRTALPRGYPPALREDALKVLSDLRPSNNPFDLFRRSGNVWDAAAKRLFDTLNRLTIALLVIRLPDPPNEDHPVVAHLDPDEQRIIAALRDRSALIRPRSDGASDNEDPRDIAIGLTDDLMETIVQLKSALESR
ncbi:hypothetical protein [Methylorubrum thiocyanatum]